MGTAATPSHLDNPFAHYISQIDAILVEDLVGEARFGPAFSFRDIEPVLGAIKDFADQFRYFDASGIAGGALGKVNPRFQELLNCVQQIRSFNPTNFGGGNYQNVIASYSQQLRDSYNNLFEAALPVLLYSNLRSSGLKNAQTRASELIAAIEKKNNEQIAALSDANQLLASQKKLSAEIAIAGYGTLFANEALGHESAAKKWLCAAGSFAVLVVIAGVANYVVTVRLLDEFLKTASVSSVPLSLPTSLTLQFAIAKVILFTVGLSAAYWSARVYRSHRHNTIVNRHRANALTSFQEFIATAADQEVKNAVLLQTTSCIYAPQPTGFTSTDGDGESPLKVLEIVRNLQK